MTATWLPRLLGVATAGYGGAVLVRPDLLLDPTGLADRHPDDPGLATLARLVAARDLASGLAMAGASGPRALRTAIGARVASDVADTVLLALALRDDPRRTKAVAVAAGWGVLCGLSALAVRRR